ncbi:uncharacterized protein [Musca autumnalis]|uniref:uncharacterized protein n=1 Tax=Musca autumnalis TaxID=221902 RepID=UPI003CF295C6
MRRSKAPSMLNKSKRVCSALSRNPENSDPEDETSFQWGSKENPNPTSSNQYASKNKRIFNVVWRDVTTKKHKTWKGDGTLEVNTFTMKAVLKDESGQYMGCSNRFKLCDLQEEHEMVIGGKEIGIQNEIKNEDEIHELRRKQVDNRNWGSEEWGVSTEEKKKPKGGFYFKPIATLKAPKKLKSLETFRQQLRNSKPVEKWGTKSNGYCFDIHNNPENEESITMAGNSTNNSNKIQSRICFIRPSELQQYLFQQICEYWHEQNENPNGGSSETLNIANILQQICNHPSFIKHIPTSNDLVKYLTSSLPHWSEMGPFDSGKLEFLQYYMQTFSSGNIKGKFIIIANNTNTQNMINGLCDFMNLKCLRLNGSDTLDIKKQVLNEYMVATTESKSSKVLLTSSVNNLLIAEVEKLQEQTIMVFESVPETMELLKKLNEINKCTIYYLITAFSIEERTILPSITLEEIINIYNIDFDDTCCYVHAKIECNCSMNNDNSLSSMDQSDDFRKWKHLNAPFDENILKDYGLANSSDNLLTIFSLTEN